MPVHATGHYWALGEHWLTGIGVGRSQEAGRRRPGERRRSVSVSEVTWQLAGLSGVRMDGHDTAAACRRHRRIMGERTLSVLATPGNQEQHVGSG